MSDELHPGDDQIPSDGSYRDGGPRTLGRVVKVTRARVQSFEGYVPNPRRKPLAKPVKGAKKAKKRGKKSVPSEAAAAKGPPTKKAASKAKKRGKK